MASRSIICRSRWLRQIIDLRDTDKSQYFAITEFNNCFVIRSPSLFQFLAGSGKRALLAEILLVVAIAHEQNIICSKNGFRRYQAWADNYLQAVICRSRGGLPANDNAGKIHRMIIEFLFQFFFLTVSLSKSLLYRALARVWKLVEQLTVDPQTTLTMLWRNLVSITGQTHEKLTSICFFLNNIA